MNWFKKLIQRDQTYPSELFDSLQLKFKHFLDLLDQNNRVLKTISDMEEKLREEFLFDMNYVTSSLEDVRSGVLKMIDCMIVLGGDDYKKLQSRYKWIDDEIELILPGSRGIVPDELTINFTDLGKNRAWSVGSKNAHLGELKASLKLPVPDGFAITAWAYKIFLEHNDLQARITDLIESVDITHYDDLARISGQIQSIVMSAKVPDIIIEDINLTLSQIIESDDVKRFSMRSSAIGEDTLFSFAGQYRTYLNVRVEDIIDRYRLVVASKFTPKAIYYFLSHSFSELDLAMSVGCVEMIDAHSAGVVYTRNPVVADDNCLIISSIFGLGRYLVDGLLTPDEIKIDRDSGQVKETHIATKPVQLALDKNSGTIEIPVPIDLQNEISISPEQIVELTKFALQIEEYYGTPQDLEWVINREGDLKILQTRPLRIIETDTSSSLPPDTNLERIAEGGETVCPGAAHGRIFHVTSPENLISVPRGTILVVPHSFPGLVTVMERVSAMIVEVGGVASHMATLAREYGLPTITGMKITEKLKQGSDATIDANNCVIYKGFAEEIIKSRKNKGGLFEDMPIIQLLKRILDKISPLTLINPTSSKFVIENCITLHDITRFSHQKAMSEMFRSAGELQGNSEFTHQLRTKIPLKVNVMLIGNQAKDYLGDKWIEDSNIPSAPMAAFWSGILEQKWPSTHSQSQDDKFSTIPTKTNSSRKKISFEESSFAVISREYMVISLHLGYHFTSVEAMCTDIAGKNYIRMQHKGGGATRDRRILRVHVIETILSNLGFTNASRGDFLDTSVGYQDKETLLEKLKLLGRMIMCTKQLDMALTNETLAKWHSDDIMRKLGIEQHKENTIDYFD